MDHYERQVRVAKDLREFFVERTKQVEEKREITPWLTFENQILLNYGVGRSMLLKLLKTFNLTIKNDELVKINDEKTS